MLTIKIPLKQAQKTKKMLVKKNLFDPDYDYVKDKNNIYFPVQKKFKSKYDFVEKKLKKRKKSINIKKEMEKKLSSAELKKLKTSFDVIGDIAILEIDKDLEKKQKILAKLIMLQNPNIKTVLKKQGAHKGAYRVQKTRFIAGERKRVAIHKENNVKLLVDIGHVYFSPRSANERKRIAGLVKKNEEILVMFSGIAPLPCVIAKNTKAKSILGIELNPRAHDNAEMNIKMNKIDNVKLKKGDVAKIVPKLNKKFDRILMPLPKTGQEFLHYAFKVSKKGTIIHLYNFLKESEFKDAKEKIKQICKKHKKNCRILRIVKAGQHSPRTYRVCIDIKIV